MTEISLSDPWGFLAIAVALALGGILKGATGVGMPIIAVPVIAAVFDVKLAVAMLVLPNLVANVRQVIKYREFDVEARFSRRFALSGAIGVAIGTYALASLPTAALSLSLSAIIFAYIALRLWKPAFRLPIERAQKMVWLAGTGGGFLQGALGISAPIAVTFANAIRLERRAFIFTLSAFFAAMCIVQVPLHIAYGLIDGTIAVLGLFAMVPLLVAVPVGEWIGARVNAVTFDRLILFFLGVLATKQVVSTLILG